MQKNLQNAATKIAVTVKRHPGVKFWHKEFYFERKEANFVKDEIKDDYYVVTLHCCRYFYNPSRHTQSTKFRVRSTINFVVTATTTTTVPEVCHKKDIFAVDCTKHRQMHSYSFFSGEIALALAHNVT